MRHNLRTMDRVLVDDYFRKSGFTAMQADAASRVLTNMLSEMKETFATKEDLLKTEARLTWRMIAIVGFFGTVVTLVNASIG